MFDISTRYERIVFAAQRNKWVDLPLYGSKCTNLGTKF